MYLLNLLTSNWNKRKWYCGLAFNHHLDGYFPRKREISRKILPKQVSCFHLITPLPIWLPDYWSWVSFFFGCKTVSIEKMFYKCPLCLTTLNSSSSCDNCTIVDVGNKKNRLCNPSKLYRRYWQLNPVILSLQEICDSLTRGFFYSNYHYDKCDQWENHYPGMVAKKALKGFEIICRRLVSSWFKITLERRAWFPLQLME